jgi:hypothetical protein
MAQGSVEYLYADIRADRVLDTQAVKISINASNQPYDWVDAEWEGDPGMFRSARVLLDGTLPRGMYTVYAQITDLPEAPIFQVGYLKIS